jgi:heme exporter protein D
MRLPLSKIYRAFPEFDPFPDSECERYLRSAYEQARFRIGCVPLLVLVVAMPVYGALLSAAVGLLVYMGFEVGAKHLFVPLALGCSVVAVPAVLALVARDMVLRSVLRDRLRTARCPNCQFSLLGLPVADDATRCPECGMMIQLRAHNLTARDLEIRRADEALRDAGGVNVRE